MKSSAKKLVISSLVWWLKKLSLSDQVETLSSLIRRSIRKKSAKKGLQFLFRLENYLYPLESDLSIAYGKGIHTKHKHIKYHSFFIRNLKPGEHVLDIGCGNGFMCYKMVTQAPGLKVTGIDLSKSNIEFAQKHYQHPNLDFIHGDALKKLPNEKFDVVTLSNVLEHFKQRVKFLKRVVQIIKPKRLIIRVPSFERDWRVPLKKELGIDYRLDPGHFIEYTQESFLKEIKRAGLEVINMECRWGEIWSVARPKKRKKHG